MLNYMKSECYRITHSKEIYLFTGILSLLAFNLNFLIGWIGRKDAGFPYDTTSFSYSNLVAAPMLFCVMGGFVAILLYDGNLKNGNLKNTIAFGISRISIFAGRCITAAAAAILSMLPILAVYIVSANLFLEHTGPVSLHDLITEIPAVLLPSIACLITTIVCIDSVKNSTVGSIIAMLIWFFVPEIFFYLGLIFPPLLRAALWMPDNFFSTKMMTVNMTESVTIWSTSAGMARCIIAGAAGILIFSIIGVVLLRKKEV